MATNSFQGVNSISGVSSFDDPNRSQSLENNTRTSLGSIQDSGLRSLLAQNTSGLTPSNYLKFGSAKLGDLNAAADKFTSVNTSGWLDQFRNQVSPLLAARSSLNRDVGYVDKSNLPKLNDILSPTGDISGLTRKQLDPYSYEYMDQQGGSMGKGYYGVDDTVRNLYRNRLGDVSASRYSPIDPSVTQFMGEGRSLNDSWVQNTLSPEQLMWAKFLGGRDPGEYGQQRKLKKQFEGLGLDLENRALDDSYYDTTPGKQAYQWGGSLYGSADEARAAREAEIMGYPTKMNAAQKQEYLGGGSAPQSWRGNYGGDELVRGDPLMSALNAKNRWAIDPRTGQYSLSGYQFDPSGLNLDPSIDSGYSVQLNTKHKKGLFGGLMEILDPRSLNADKITESGSNVLYRDVNSPEQWSQYLYKDPSTGQLMVRAGDVQNLPGWYDRNKHTYDYKSENVKVPNTRALSAMTAAGTIGDILFPQFTWGGGAAGSQAIWARANRDATGQSIGDIHSQGLKNWGTGALSAYLGGLGADAGGAMGTAGTATETAGRAIGGGLGSAAGSAIGQGLSTGDWGSAAKGFGKGALSSLVGAGLGYGGNSMGLNPALTSAIQKIGRAGTSSALSGKKPSNQQTASMLLGTLLGGLGQYNQNSTYRS